MSQRIEIVVDPRGGVRIETKGYIGESCQEASRFLEEALGRRTAERRTAAFYQPAQNLQDHHQRQQDG